MNEKKCFFIGHRYAPNTIKERLAEVIEQHIIEYGVTIFTVGHYGAFDRLVEKVLSEKKKQYPNIKLYLLEPYALDRKTEAPKDFVGTLYPDGMETVPKPFAIVQANRFMIQRSNYLISYCRGFGNTWNFVEYAQKLEKRGLIKVTLI